MIDRSVENSLPLEDQIGTCDQSTQELWAADIIRGSWAEALQARHSPTRSSSCVPQPTLMMIPTPGS
ncbi:hypothetical protein COCON_G00193350 [Conger conger]|uniref:Uncharacterized protein n=1 Tax=Conger conger TaxID=82655 RepID=A0A9Q1D0A4_CONCO|nr:hypothetical protein COCON_G00193350 [Conger conger]